MKSIKFSGVIFIMITLSLIFFSCKHKHDEIQTLCGDSIPPVFNLVLKDINDSLLIGKEYSQDTVSLTLNNKKVNFFIYKGIITVTYDTLQPYSSGEYILYLSKSDQDTLNLIIKTHTPAECPEFIKLDSLLYNHKFMPPNQGDLTYKIIKN